MIYFGKSLALPALLYHGARFLKACFFVESRSQLYVLRLAIVCMSMIQCTALMESNCQYLYWRFNALRFIESSFYNSGYSKNGIPGMAYFFMASILMSTPIPGFSERGIKLFFTHSPSYCTISLNIGSVWK